MERAPKTCILCKAAAREFLVRKGPWTVYRCAVCGLGVLDPRPSEDELAALYAHDYFADQYDHGLDPASREFLERLRSEGHRVRFVQRAKRKGRILDMGCGFGYFLAAARAAGFEVHGYDISQWAAQYARAKLEIPVEVGQLGEVAFPPRTFDAVTMWHFLEHTADPGEVLARSRQWLKPDGVLAVDVPNYLGTDARLMGPDWVGWQLPYHFHHFGPAPLKGLLAKHGFRIVRTKTYHSEVIKLRLKRIPLLSPLARTIARFYAGTSVAVIARKS